MRIRSLLLGCAIAGLPAAAAAQTGSISGTVIRSDTSAPIASARILAVREIGGTVVTVGQVLTNASGVYTISGLPPATYYALTSVNGFINEIYDNIPCIGCSTTTAVQVGTPVVVTSGVTSSNRNFALAPGGRIRGTVTDETTGLPIAGVTVRVVDSVTRGQVASATSNAMGEYTTTTSLASRTYYAYTSNSAGYLDEVYNNIDCGTSCSSVVNNMGGTPIVVTAPAETAGVNFALVKSASIAGTVTSAATGLPLAGASVTIVNAQFQAVGFAMTDDSGAYLEGGLKAGTYYAAVHNADGYINEMYDNLPCLVSCSWTGATPIVVAAGAAITGKDFALTPGGRISGTVRAASTLEPLSGYVRIYSAAAAEVTEAYADESGAYITGPGLPTGTYYATFQPDDEQYVSEIYDDIICSNFCQPADAATRGTPIAVTIGATTAGRDFLLSRGGRIAGRVTNAATGAGVVVQIEAHGPGGFRGDDVTNADGTYEIQGLPPGAYVVFTVGASDHGFVDEVHDNLPCLVRCDEDPAASRGTKVNVAIDATTSGINFALAAAGTIHGVVTDSASGAALERVAVFVFSAASGPGAPVELQYAAVYTDAAGAFTLTGVPAGSYYLYTENEDGYIDEAFANLPCLGGCPGAARLGNPISVAAGLPSTGVDFALDPGGRISGVVRDAATSAGVGGRPVDIVDAAGRFLQRAFTAGTSGAYITPTGLASGTYYAAALTDDGAHLSEAYGGAACPGLCSPEAIIALSSPIVVTAGVTTDGRDFALDRGAQIEGTVRQAGTGVPVTDEDRTVNFYDNAGRFAAIAYVDGSTARFESGGVPSGSYFGFTTSFTHVNEIYDNIPCAVACEPSRAPGGTPIVATAGTNTLNIDFALSPRSGVPGAPIDLRFSTHPQGVLISWLPPESGGIAVSYRLEAGLSPGTTAVSFAVNEPQFLAIGAPPGQYFVRVKAINATGTGPSSPDAPLVIGAGGALPGAPRSVRAWMYGPRLMMTWEDAASGGTPTQYLVEAGTAAGLANIATLPATKRAFTYTPVPAGFYFLRVRAVNGSGASAPSSDVMLVVGGTASPPRAPYHVGAKAIGSTVTLAWSAPAGPVTGYVIEAGSAPGLSNLAALQVGLVTTMSFPNIPPGRYYVRIRAVNALGRGVASEEMVVVVG